MKLFIALLFVTSSTFAFAAKDCSDTAIRVAKENSRLGLLQSLATVETERSYLVSYEVTLRSSQRPVRTETFEVTMLKSDCTVISLLPKF